MYQPNHKSNYEAIHSDAVKGKTKLSSSLLPTLQNCNKSKQSCICSTTTVTSHIQSNIYLQQHSSLRSSGYFTNNHMINQNNPSQLYSQHHSFLETNNNGLSELDNTFSDFSTSMPSSPKGAEQILMILMCNGMTAEFDQFNGKFNTTSYKSSNRLRNNCTATSSTTTPTSSASTTPSSSISSPNCNDNLKDHLHNPTSTNNPLVMQENTESDIFNQPITCTNATHSNEMQHNQDQYLSESSNKLDENLTLPPSPCVSDISEADLIKNSDISSIQPLNEQNPDQNLIHHKIESAIQDSIVSCPLADHHGETTDESSDEEGTQNAKTLKTEPLLDASRNKDQKTMSPELQLDSAESSGFVGKSAKTYSFRDATIFILSQVGKPMTAVDITKYIFEYKMVKSEGKTPERTVAAMIYQEMKKKKNTTEFALFGSGLFGLSSWKSDDHTSQDTASVSTDASLSSQKSVDRAKKKKEKKKRKLNKPEEVSEQEESDSDLPIPTRKPRRMHKPKLSSDEISIDSEQVTCCSKKRKHNPEETAVIVTEETLFKTYIKKLKKKERDQVDEDECFVCKNGGELICCDYGGCMKVYHPTCVGLTEVPQGDWICPHHYCAECKKQSIKSQSVKKCFTCPFGVCDEHVSLLKDKIDMEKYVCSNCKPLCEHIK